MYYCKYTHWTLNVICRDLGWQQRYAPFCGRIVVLSILILLLYPFLWVWTVIGTIWFTNARSCVSFLFFSSFFLNLATCFLGFEYFMFLWMQLPEEGQKWGFLIWLLFSYCGLVCIACMCIGKVCCAFNIVISVMVIPEGLHSMHVYWEGLLYVFYNFLHNWHICTEFS